MAFMESSNVDSRIAEVLRIIDAELTGNLSVASLARRTYVSPSRLAHLFRYTMGISLGCYVRRRRVEIAMDLLASFLLL